ncbi:MAG TPA: cytochrome c [Vulgatibacter sp.]|nr:cytochrome c [Vulgatibacter sp.]
MRKTIAIAVIVPSALLVAACSKDAAPEAGREAAVAPAPSREASGGGVDPASEKEAKEIFANRCAPCHGPTGGGDGPASAGFDPRPANLGSPQWQASVTDEHIERIVQYGGAAVGKSAAMPANPDLMGKPEVVKALRMYIRSLKK